MVVALLRMSFRGGLGGCEKSSGFRHSPEKMKVVAPTVYNVASPAAPNVGHVCDPELVET